jgi:WXG100 family type VII secretion target
MPSGFAGEVAQFSQAHKNVETARNTLDAELKKLRGEIEQTRAGWKGGAAEAFQQLMARFDENAVKLNNALQGIGEQLQAAGSTYEAAEEEQASVVNNITKSLG